MRFASAIFALTIVACASTKGPSADEQAAIVGPSVAGTVVFGPGDVFELRVFGEEDLSGAYRVSDDGTIDFPLIGKTSVEGETGSSLSTLLSTKLAKYLRQPSVSVFLKEYNSKKVFVLGQVKSPGTFPFEKGMSIIQAIAMAGGFERLADQNSCSVTRVVNGKETRSQIAVKDIGEGQIANFQLQPGDIVFVPERLF